MAVYVSLHLDMVIKSVMDGTIFFVEAIREIRLNCLGILVGKN